MSNPNWQYIRIAQAKRRSEDLERQNAMLRSERQQPDERVLELEANVQKLTKENDALRTGQKEFNMLRSQLDSAKSDVEEWKAKAKQYQAEAELAKKRENEIKELQGLVKSLTSRLENHMKAATTNEDNHAEIVQLRSQIDTLKANNVELNVALESKKQQVEQLELQLIQYKKQVTQIEEVKKDTSAEQNKTVRRSKRRIDSNKKVNSDKMVSTTDQKDGTPEKGNAKKAKK